MRQLPLGLVPEPSCSFASFLPGPNAEALALLSALVPPVAPLYLWGPTGSGRTHLLRALAGACLDRGGRVHWLEPASTQAWSVQPDLMLVVLDDVHLFTPARQQEAFALMVDAQSHGIPWAASGDAPPVDLELRDDLRSRLGWGHVFGLKPLDEDHTRAVLRREADRRGLRLSDEVMDYLLHRFARDLSSLMRWLDRLDEFSMSRGRAVTVPLLREMLAEAPAVAERAA
jgi:DnaA family protein